MKTYPIPCTKEEINAIINFSIDDDFFYTLFNVAKTTGRRLGELYNVKVKDFQPDRNVLVTQVMKRRKHVEKEAILSNEVTRLLQRYIIREKFKLDDYIFRKVSYRQIQNAIKTYAEKAGVKHNVSFHNFRHYLVTELYRKGWDYSRIAKLTGHSNPGTLAIYDHAVASDIKVEALEALEGI